MITWRKPNKKRSKRELARFDVEKSPRGLDARMKLLEAEVISLRETVADLQAQSMDRGNAVAPVEETFFPGSHENQPNGQHFNTHKT
jgi:hypothetical protein